MTKWLILVVSRAISSAEAGAPKVVVERRLTGGGTSDLQGVTFAGDGTIYVVGNTAAPLASAPDGAKLTTLGEPATNTLCGAGFVAQLSADGQRVLAITQFAPGAAILTSVAVNSNGVYIAGYATETLAPLIVDAYPLSLDAPAPIPRLPDGHETPRQNRLATARPGLGRQGAPFIARLPATLAQIESGRYLEGWQQVWDVPRERGYQGEWAWQPTSLGFLANGDVVVARDGGYDLGWHAVTPEERRENFNHVCDYVSRLSPDLKQRAWRRDIYTPLVNREAVAALRPGWAHDHYGNPRLLRLRTDVRDHIYICGWSASATAKEPWWTPFLWKLDGTGAVVWKSYSPDPLSGDDHRLHGNVSDAGVSSVALDEAGQVLATTIGDGGNSVLRRDPLDWRNPAPNLKGMVSGFKGRILYWGTAVRLDGRTGALRAGNHIAASSPTLGTVAAWGIDLAPLPGDRVLVAGRYFDQFPFTKDAWHTNHASTVSHGFLRVCTPEFNVRFSTAVPDLIPFTVARHGARVAVAGQARPAATNTPAHAYLLVADFPE